MNITGPPRSGASVAAALLAFLPCAPAAAACDVDTGTTRGALAELYTSEGCSSCPPADARLHRLTTAGPRVVPLALHVDYWDSIGWKDRFAQPAFTERQRWEVRANAHRTSFTPHFFVNGREVQDWRADLDDALVTAAQPAAARIAITADPQSGGKLRIRVDASSMPDGRPHASWRLFVVVTEDRLSSQVDAGENRGVRLEHDAVARDWIGPIAFPGDNASFDRVLAVPQVANGHVGVVAFVQDAKTAEVLQAAGTGACKPG